jgi:hypothetical protein
MFPQRINFFCLMCERPGCWRAPYGSEFLITALPISRNGTASNPPAGPQIQIQKDSDRKTKNGLRVTERPMT